MRCWATANATKAQCGKRSWRPGTTSSTTWSFVIDYNKVQAKGFLSEDMSIEPLADKLRAFNL